MPPTAVADHLAAIPGVPESALAPAQADALPAPAPAPWDVVLEAVVWVHRATPEAVDQLPPELRDRRMLPLTVATLVRYLETPVGPYAEVFASPAFLLGDGAPALHVPFIAVDSPASVAGGRANWSLPKALARFTWPGGPDALGARRAPLDLAAVGEPAPGAPAWSVEARARANGPAVPFSLHGRALQATPAGALLDIGVDLRGRGRPALVQVRTSGPSLPAWLRAGRHAGAVLRGVRGHVAAPR